MERMPVAARAAPRALTAARCAWRDAVGVLLPVDCGGCGRPGPPLCDTCAASLDGRAAAVERVADARLPFPVFAALPYEGPVAGCLRVFKDRGRVDLARPLSAPLRASVVAAWACTRPGGRSPPVLLAIPSSQASTRRRGYAPVPRLLRSARLQPSPGARLIVVRRVADQAGLDVAARAANLAGAFRASGVEGLRVVLVDDVVTTGSTLLEASRAVDAAGGEVISAACLAHAQRRAMHIPDGTSGTGDETLGDDSENGQ